MPRKLALRALTEQERDEIQHLVKSRTTAVRLVQRAKVLWAMAEDKKLSAAQAGRQAGYKSEMSGALWVKRFNAQGLAGLRDEARAGHPRVHDETVRSALVSLATQKPDGLGYPFKLWTLARLQTAFHDRQQVHLSDSTIWTWLAQEGLAWKRQQSWFHEAEKHDPQFVEKRGP